jgi:hypothetical protein
MANSWPSTAATFDRGPDPIRVSPKCQLCKLTDMSAPRLGKFAPITLGHMRWQACHGLLARCNSSQCNHAEMIDVGHLPDDVPIKSLRIVCGRCGRASVRVMPNWSRI